MSCSLLARALLAGLALGFLAVPAALADDPPPSTTTEATTTGATTTEETEPPPPDLWAESARAQRLLAVALRKRAITRHWHALMRRPRPRVHPPTTPFESLLARRQWGAGAWRATARRARFLVRHPPHLWAWRCIHAYEARWRDPNAPYYGGLQMDLTFQRQYGLALLRRKGTADNWTWFEQMWVAERALRAGRGFYPWPVTARRCGLI